MEPSARDSARACVGTALAAGGGWLSTADCEALLRTAGVAVAGTRVVRSADEAVAAATEIGFPVVLKAIGPALLHKTEAGAVKLRLASADEVRAAYADLDARLGAAMESALVQPMLSGGVEVVVGGLNDPAFGPLVMCGTGGIFVELVADTVFGMCPLGGTGAARLIEQMKGKALLRGFRGAPAVDEAALRRLLVRTSQLVEACPEIQEMDLNPVMVLPEGAVAADVRIKVGPRPRPVPGRRIAY
jgi:acyl-CoA synthetase (NDP forming)